MTGHGHGGGTRFKVVVQDGYGKETIVEGDSLEEVWAKMGEKVAGDEA